MFVKNSCVKEILPFTLLPTVPNYLLISGRESRSETVHRDLESAAKVLLSRFSYKATKRWYHKSYIPVALSGGSKRTKSLVSYFENQDYPSATKSHSKTQMVVLPNNDDICQIRYIRSIFHWPAHFWSIMLLTDWILILQNWRCQTGYARPRCRAWRM